MYGESIGLVSFRVQLILTTHSHLRICRWTRRRKRFAVKKNTKLLASWEKQGYVFIWKNIFVCPMVSDCEKLWLSIFLKTLKKEKEKFRKIQIQICCRFVFFSFPAILKSILS